MLKSRVGALASILGVLKATGARKPGLKILARRPVPPEPVYGYNVFSGV